MKNLLLILPALLLFACCQPRSTEQFLRGAGPYEFSVEMTDSTVCYDFDLFTRIDATEFPTQLQLDITWKDPTAARFTETVYLPVSRGRAFFSQESYAPYRAGVVPREYGTWTMTVSVPSPPEGLCGMGLVVRQRVNDAQVVVYGAW